MGKNIRVLVEVDSYKTPVDIKIQVDDEADTEDRLAAAITEIVAQTMAHDIQPPVKVKL